MIFDPYAELGIPADASIATVRKAYRAKAKKTHPDAPGGDGEAFQRLSKALTIITDPVKRRKFDRTGVIDDQVDNDRAQALQLIVAFINAAIDDYIANNFDPRKDPRKVDLMEYYRMNARLQMDDFAQSEIKGQKALALAKDMRARFSGKDDTLARMIDDRIAMYQSDLAECAKAFQSRRLSIEISRGYKFRFD